METTTGSEDDDLGVGYSGKTAQRLPFNLQGGKPTQFFGNQ